MTITVLQCSQYLINRVFCELHRVVKVKKAFVSSVSHDNVCICVSKEEITIDLTGNNRANSDDFSRFIVRSFFILHFFLFRNYSFFKFSVDQHI